MAAIEPLRLRLVNRDFADRVPSPAHDSLTPEGRRFALAANPDSYLAVTRSIEDLDPAQSISNDELLTLCQASLDRLITKGAFDEERPPQFFAYQLAGDDHRQTGLVGGVATSDFVRGDVRVHEQIHHARATHLARHLAVVRVQSSPIAVAHRPIPALRAILDRAAKAEPLLTICSEPGFTQHIWPLDPATSSEITALLRDHPLYLIDGHHRGAAAIEHRRLVGPGPADATLSVLFSTDELRNFAFHRVLPRSIGPVDTAPALIARAARPIDEPRASDDGQHDTSPHEIVHHEIAPHEITMYDGSARRWWAVPAPRVPGVDPSLTDLAPTRLAALLDDTFGAFAADGVGGHRWRDQVRYRPGVLPRRQLQDEADERHDVLFVLPALGIDALTGVADAGLTMPPKSTYFDPKVRSGIFLRHL